MNWQVKISKREYASARKNIACLFVLAKVNQIKKLTFHTQEFVQKENLFIACVAKCKQQETLGNFPVMLSARSVETCVLAIVRLVKVISLVSLEIKRFV